VICERKWFVSELPSSAQPAETNESEISMQTFLEEVPPNEQRSVSDMAISAMHNYLFRKPDLTLFCPNAICNRAQTFGCTDDRDLPVGDALLHYRCRNCQRTTKTFAIRFVGVRPRGSDGRLLKIGEQPAFGPPLPARLQRLVQPDRGFLVKGFQSEIKGHGIGAFAYYRRVVEDEKDRLIDEIIKVCKKTPGADKFISGLEEAKKQVQFTTAVEQIADAIPEALRISGHNPLTLLHPALSKSLHKDSDEDCLEAAHAIRVMLAAFAERLSQLLKDEAEVTNAIGTLLAKKKKEDSKSQK